MLSSRLTFLLDAQQPADLSRLAEHLPYEWIERAVQAAGVASIRRRRLPAEQVVWLVIALAMYRHWSISEVLNNLDLALPDHTAPFVSKSAVAQARQRVGEERIQYSAMTGQSLFYLGETDLQHRILAIAEEEGVRQAAYALKLLQSDGELTIASTGKDETTGNLVTKQYRVQGPVMLMLTTTAIDVDEELLNRCLVLTINESREQTQQIHAMQRAKQTLEGLLAETDRAHIIEALAYIEVVKADIALANRIAHEVLGRTLDELPPQTRRLLKLVHAMVVERSQKEHVKPREVRFTRREISTAARHHPAVTAIPAHQCAGPHRTTALSVDQALRAVA